MSLPVIADPFLADVGAATPQRATPDANAPMPGHDDTVVILACFVYEAAYLAKHSSEAPVDL